jgi:hypothetical protein
LGVLRSEQDCSPRNESNHCCQRWKSLLELLHSKLAKTLSAGPVRYFVEMVPMNTCGSSPDRDRGRVKMLDRSRRWLEIHPIIWSRDSGQSLHVAPREEARRRIHRARKHPKGGYGSSRIAVPVSILSRHPPSVSNHNLL